MDAALNSKISKSPLFYSTTASLLVLLFLHLYKQSLIVDAQYSLQTYQNLKQQTEKQIKDLKKELVQAKSHKSIAKKAKKLGLKKVNIKQIERL